MRKLMYLCFVVFMLVGYAELKAQSYLVREVEGSVRTRENQQWKELKPGNKINGDTKVTIGKGAKLVLLEAVRSGQKATFREYTFSDAGTASVIRFITKPGTTIRDISKTLFLYYLRLLVKGISNVTKHILNEGVDATVTRDIDSLLLDLDLQDVVIVDSLVVPADTVVAP